MVSSAKSIKGKSIILKRPEIVLAPETQKLSLNSPPLPTTLSSMKMFVEPAHIMILSAAGLAHRASDPLVEGRLLVLVLLLLVQRGVLRLLGGRLVSLGGRLSLRCLSPQRLATG